MEQSFRLTTISSTTSEETINKQDIRERFKDIPNFLDSLNKNTEIVDLIKQKSSLFDDFCVALDVFLFPKQPSSNKTEDPLLILLKNIKDNQSLADLLILPKCTKIFSLALNSFLNSGYFGELQDSKLLILIEELSENPQLAYLLILQECNEIFSSALDFFLNRSSLIGESKDSKFLKLLQKLNGNPQLADLLIYHSCLKIFIGALEHFLFPDNFFKSYSRNLMKENIKQQFNNFQTLINHISRVDKTAINLLLQPEVFPLFYKAVCSFFECSNRPLLFLFCMIVDNPNLTILFSHSYYLPNSSKTISCFPKIIDLMKRELKEDYCFHAYWTINLETLFKCFISNDINLQSFFIGSKCFETRHYKIIKEAFETDPYTILSDDLIYDINELLIALTYPNFFEYLKKEIMTLEYQHEGNEKFILLFRFLSYGFNCQDILQNADCQNVIKNAICAAIDNYNNRDGNQYKMTNEMLDLFLDTLMKNLDFSEKILRNNEWSKIIPLVLEYNLVYHIEKENYDRVDTILSNIIFKNFTKILLQKLHTKLIEYYNIDKLDIYNCRYICKMLNRNPDIQKLTLENDNFKNKIKNLLVELKHFANLYKHEQIFIINFTELLSYLKSMPKLQPSILNDNYDILITLFTDASNNFESEDYRHWVKDYFNFILTLDKNTALLKIVKDIRNPQSIFKRVGQKKYDNNIFNESYHENLINLFSIIIRNPLLNQIFKFDKHWIKDISNSLKTTSAEKNVILYKLLKALESFQTLKKISDEGADLYNQINRVCP